MSATPIQNPLSGEDLIGIEPELLQQGDNGWLHRLALFTGRALTAPALSTEQQYRSGRLAILGQSVTQGIVRGLDLSLDLTSADPILLVAPGYGISATGEDVALLRPLRTALSSLSVIDPQSGSLVSQFSDYAADPRNQSHAGVLLLQPIVGQVSGATVDTGNGPIMVSGNLAASCDQDPLEYAFEDWQLADGVRLVLVAWPSTPASLALPPLFPAATWRNRLAYAVFSAEAGLTYDQRLPWDLLGVPLALVGFDANWKLQFADRSAVARAGGLPRRRYVLPGIPGGAGTPFLIQPALAQARITQLAEQLGASLPLTSAPLNYAFLPPCGILPASVMNFGSRSSLWFPSAWAVEAAPIHQEEVETALHGAMTALPLRVLGNEVVEILVPLPDTVYDPDILQTETVDPAFPTEVQNATTALTTILQHRKLIQQESNALLVPVAGSQGQPPIDLNGGLTSTEIALRDGPSAWVPDPKESFGTTLSGTSFVSQDLQGLKNLAQSPPYTFPFSTTDSTGKAVTTVLQLFSSDDLADLDRNGLQFFINGINAKLAKADDLLDLGFLTTQADIYRLRQYLLSGSDATKLAVSPIVANIAQGESANSTAENLQKYLASIKAPTPAPPGASPAPAANATPPAGAGIGNLAARFNIANTGTAVVTPANLASANLVAAPVRAALPGLPGSARGVVSTALQGTVAALPQGTFVAPTSAPPTPIDVIAQAPVVGGQLNLRTLTIADRLTPPASQDAVFYSVTNRVNILNLLAELEITVDDLKILVDSPPANIPTPTIFHLRAGSTAIAGVIQQVKNPTVTNDSDESNLFSVGIHVLEQHTQLLRDVEARVQQYRDFLTLCQTALTAIQGYQQQAQTLLKQLENDLVGARQNLAFVNALLNDEIQRVNSVNQQRTSVLQTYVTFVVYARGRTLTASDNVPSRQLVPGNIASPVPACLQQSVAIPPELREIVSLLREAPVAWLPAVAALLNRLERPSLLQAVAVSTQARAATQLMLPLPASSADSETGIYAPVISNLYIANQQVFRSFQTQRATFNPVQMFNQSWSAQVQILQNVSAVADLISSGAVHAEVVNATSRLIQQISSVATCLYVRAGQVLPVERLAWAEYLRGPGLSVSLQTLAALPNWNLQDYVSRQQMQLLVDWLFQQIDATNADAAAFLSDVVRVAILLASHAPVDDVIAGAVTLRTKPVVGGVVHLTLPSTRIAAGMYVQLYTAGELAAQAVVQDLDSSGVRATFTTVYRPDVYLEANDVVHYTAQAPQAVALRAFSP